jgi:hypothetical protein
MVDSSQNSSTKIFLDFDQNCTKYKLAKEDLLQAPLE